MPLYVADYLADTGHLSAAEHGAYLLLIMHYWQNGGLPNEDRRLARIARMSAAEWDDARETLFDMFEDCWRHHRIDAELAAAAGIMESRSKAGSAGAASKWGGNARSTRATRSQRLSEAREKGTHVKEQWDAMVAHCGGKCVRCAASGPVVKDHIVPIYQGGSDGIENLQPLCNSCNSSKGPDTTDFRPDGWQAKCLTNASQTPAQSQPQSQSPTTTVSNDPVVVRAKAQPEQARILESLMSILTEDRARAVVDHRRKKKSPLTLHAANLLVGQFSQLAEPDKAADLMISRGWQGCDPDWCVNAGLKRAEAVPHSSDLETQWRNKLTRYRTKGDWPGVWGDPPGHPCCTIPAAFIAKFDPQNKGERAA